MGIRVCVEVPAQVRHVTLRSGGSVREKGTVRGQPMGLVRRLPRQRMFVKVAVVRFPTGSTGRGIPPALPEGPHGGSSQTGSNHLGASRDGDLSLPLREGVHGPLERKKK